MYLQDRPHHVVKHCMQRMHAAKSDFISQDIVQQSETIFSVKSKGASTNPDGTTKWWYNVQLGNDHSFPKCECFDFKHHYLPCKHFFAIYQAIHGILYQTIFVTALLLLSTTPLFHLVNK